MNRMKHKQDISSKVQNMKSVMDSLFTENESKSISSILSDFKSNRSIQYLVDNVQPYIDTKVKLIFLRYLSEIIPTTHRERFHNYCASKGLVVNEAVTDMFEVKRLSSTFPRTHNWNSYIDFSHEGNEMSEMFDMKSSSYSKDGEVHIRRRNSNFFTPKSPINHVPFTMDNFNSHRYFVCRLGRLTTKRCTSYEQSLQAWGISWWRSHSTYSVYVLQIDELSLYRHNNILERGIQVGQRLKQINNKEISKVADEEFLDILDNSMIIELILQGDGITVESLWEKAGGDYKWVDCLTERSCHPPISYTISMDSYQLKPIELIKEATQDLGINIRGGKEYSLGIYISSVKDGSIGSFIGLQSGDKILQINSLGLCGHNIPFQNDAVNMIHKIRSGDIWVYSLHKLPLTIMIPETRSRSVGHLTKRREIVSVLESKGMFHKGQRNQLTHTSLTQPSLENMELQMSELISKQDVNKILFLLEKYRSYEINVHQLVTALYSNVQGLWNQRLVNIIMNSLRINDRMHFKLKLEVIQSLFEDKGFQKKSDGAFMSPKAKLCSPKKENDEDGDIPVTRTHKSKKSTNTNSINFEMQDSNYVNNDKESDSIHCERKDNLTDVGNEYDQLEMIYGEEFVIHNKTEVSDVKYEKEMTDFDEKVFGEEENKLVTSQVLKVPKEYFKLKYEIPKEEIITLSQNKVKKLIKVPKAVPLLGISIEGGVDTPHPLARVAKIDLNSCAGLCPVIDVGDIIMEVDGIPLAGLEHSKIAHKIAEAFKSATDSIEFLLIKLNNTSPNVNVYKDYQSTYL